MDYTGKERGQDDNPLSTPKQEKTVTKVVTGDVSQRPKGISFKFRKIFLGMDLKHTTDFVVSEYLIPELRDIIFRVGSRYLEGIIFGESRYARKAVEYRSTSKISYNNVTPAPWRRDPREDYIDVSSRVGRVPDQTPRPTRVDRRDIADIILSSRAEAEMVVESMMDILSHYEVVSLADMYTLVGLPTSFVDNNWGWKSLNDVQVRQVGGRGYIIEFPPVEVIA
jgi:hypothetical protein